MPATCLTLLPGIDKDSGVESIYSQHTLKSYTANEKKLKFLGLISCFKCLSSDDSQSRNSCFFTTDVKLGRLDQLYDVNLHCKYLWLVTQIPFFIVNYPNFALLSHFSELVVLFF